jgi:hypothetical protein
VVAVVVVVLEVLLVQVKGRARGDKAAADQHAHAAHGQQVRQQANSDSRAPESIGSVPATCRCVETTRKKTAARGVAKTRTVMVERHTYKYWQSTGN